MTKNQCWNKPVRSYVVLTSIYGKEVLVEPISRGLFHLRDLAFTRASMATLWVNLLGNAIYLADDADTFTQQCRCTLILTSSTLLKILVVIEGNMVFYVFGYFDPDAVRSWIEKNITKLVVLGMEDQALLKPYRSPIRIRRRKNAGKNSPVISLKVM